jgi:branched-chain amino acid transport system ATP-binding protein
VEPVILSASMLRVGYRSQEVLHDLDIALRRGEICGIIGPNGAGKSTLLKSFYGLLKPKSGSITFDGEDITGVAPRARLQMGISYVPQERSVFPNLSVTENLELALTSLPDRRSGNQEAEQREFLFDLFPRLRERRLQLVGTMSGGEQRMVAISIGLMARPRVLMLDEPTTGLAPKVVHQLMDVIKRLNVDHSISTIIVEQNVLSMLKIADRVHIIKNGRGKEFEGSPRDFTQQQILASL